MRYALIIAALALASGSAQGQDLTPVETVAPPSAAPVQTVVTDGTPISIAIDKHLGSKLSKKGEAFPIVLAAPLVIDGKELLPAGVRGEGEVVHAAKSGLGGRPGELILAARYLDTPDGRVRLRGFQFASAGKDRSGTVIYSGAVLNGAASLAGSMAPVGMLTMLITGGEIDVPQGAAATAKISGEFRITERLNAQ